MVNRNGFRVGVVYWTKGDGIAADISGTVEDLGHEAINFLYDARLPAGLDVILCYGPMASLASLANQLLACPPFRRPAFALWVSESLPNPALPEWARRVGGMVRSRAERLAYRENGQGEWVLDPRLVWMTTKAFRFRYYGDLFWLRRQGILNVLVIPSQWIASFLRARGFDPIVAYYGSPPGWGADLGLERDIPVLWLGKIGTGRRRSLLGRVRDDLRGRGVEILMVDGVENPYVFGKERITLLNRTKITLNISREQWEDSSLRYFIVAPNRAMIVTEPTLPHTPFQHGVHLVEAPIDHMADTICYYLSHEEERQRVADQAHQLVTTELTMKSSVSQILERASVVQQGAVSESICSGTGRKSGVNT